MTELKTRYRQLKIFIGRAKSQSSKTHGQLVLTVVSAYSRASALTKLQSVAIECSKRSFEQWACEDKNYEYSFIRKEGVWQSDRNPTKCFSDYTEVPSNE